jgi:hypothetical protein
VAAKEGNFMHELQAEGLSLEVAKRLSSRYGRDFPQLVAEVIDAQKTGRAGQIENFQGNPFAKRLVDIVDAITRLWREITPKGLRIELRKKVIFEELKVKNLCDNEDDEIVATTAVEVIYSLVLSLEDED